ncbi:MAG: tetratricopeptide repeat protein [Candidatus Aminicenantes bacterium]|nr:tetratricopeptide repeat protein [Candidatus Aminicenantes bacterium]
MKKAIVWTAILGGILGLLGCAPGKPSAGPGTVNPAEFKTHLDQGIQALSVKDYARAALCFERAVAADPRASRAYNLLGIALFQQKNTPQAKAMFEKAISLRPDYAEAYNNLGGVFCLLKEFEKAKEMFRQAVGLSPQDVSATYSLGHLLLMLGETEEGMTWLAKGIELDPDFLEKHKDMTVGLAYEEYNEAEIEFAYARLFAAAGNVDKTLVHLERADRASFKDWARVLTDAAFERVRDDPKIREFLKSRGPGG